MVVSFEALQKITRGALAVTAERDGYAVFSRFSEKQVRFYAETNLDFLRKTRATSGVQLVFGTDARALSFTYRMHRSTSRPYGYFDLCCDGILLCHEGTDVSTEPLDGTFSCDLPAGTHRLTLYLPNFVSLEIKDLTLAGATVLSSCVPARKILCFGDSITQGYDAVYPSLSYINLLAASLDAEVLNQAIGGEMFNAGVVDGALPFTPDLIMAAYGTNDFTHRRGTAAFTEEAGRFFTALTAAYPQTRIVYLSPIWRYTADEADFIAHKHALEKLAASYPRVTVVDGYTLTPHLRDFYSDRCLHPNDLGFSVYAANLERELRRIL